MWIKGRRFWYQWGMLGFGRKSITVTLVAHGMATRLVKPGVYQVKEGARVKTLLKLAGLASGSVPLVLLIAGERVSLSRSLVDGDEVICLQFTAGG